eukprot:scaffold10357_cov66-Attheya_sp.AAC.3
MLTTVGIGRGAGQDMEHVLWTISAARAMSIRKAGVSNIEDAFLHQGSLSEGLDAKSHARGCVLAQAGCNIESRRVVAFGKVCSMLDLAMGVSSGCTVPCHLQRHNAESVRHPSYVAHTHVECAYVKQCKPEISNSKM